MELELKHLSAYLPYGLQFLSHKHRLKYSERTLLTARGVSLTDKGELVVEFLFDDDLIFSNEMKSCVPLLRPMDLTKEIKGVGIPIVELAKMGMDVSGDILGKWEFAVSQHYVSATLSHRDSEVVFSYDFNDSSFMLFQTHINDGKTINVCNQLQLFEWLFNHHFDVYGLLSENLAEPIKD